MVKKVVRAKNESLQQRARIGLFQIEPKMSLSASWREKAADATVVPCANELSPFPIPRRPMPVLLL